LRRRSRDQHVPRLVARVEQLDGPGAEIIEATLAIRNTLAYRSVKAVKQMNACVASFPSYAMLRKPTMSKNGIGTQAAHGSTLRVATGAAHEIAMTQAALDALESVDDRESVHDSPSH
jgi:hypothetical protein